MVDHSVIQYVDILGLGHTVVAVHSSGHGGVGIWAEER